jgi:hypothetical protein
MDLLVACALVLETSLGFSQNGPKPESVETSIKRVSQNHAFIGAEGPASRWAKDPPGCRKSAVDI